MGGAKKIARYEFLFVGAGDADYFEWAGVTVCFASEPSAAARAAIERAVPTPLADLEWSGRFLSAASEQMVHVYIASTYDADGDEQDDLEGGPIWAAPSKVRRFNEDIERWLREAHAISPICVAFRAEDSEAGGTRFSKWHHESVQRLPEYLPRLQDVLDGDADSTGAYLLRGILELATDAKRPPAIPNQFMEWFRPGGDAIAALARGDNAPLRHALESPSEELIERLEGELNLRDNTTRSAFLRVAPEILGNVSRQLLELLVVAALLQGEPDGELIRAIGERSTKLHESPGVPFVDAIRRFEREEDFASAHKTLRMCLEHLTTPDRVPLYYLYIFIDTKRFDQVDRELLERCTELCPKDVPLLLNVTYVWIELGEHQRALDAVALFCRDGSAVPGFAQLNVAIARFGLGDFDGCLEAARDALAAEDLGGHMMQAAVAAARGQRDEALKLLRLAKKKYDDFWMWAEDWTLSPLHDDPDYRALFQR